MEVNLQILALLLLLLTHTQVIPAILFCFLTAILFCGPAIKYICFLAAILFSFLVAIFFSFMAAFLFSFAAEILFSCPAAILLLPGHYYCIIYIFMSTILLHFSYPSFVSCSNFVLFSMCYLPLIDANYFA